MPTKGRPKSFGDRLRDARKDLPQDELAQMVSTYVGTKVTASTISRYESGRIAEEGANLLIVWAIAEILEVSLAELSPYAEARRQTMKAFLIRTGSRCLDGRPG